VKDGTVGFNGPSDEIIIILEFDDENFGLGSVIGFLADTEVGVGFERLRREQSIFIQRDSMCL
jgi:hypothetical protein